MKRHLIAALGACALAAIVTNTPAAQSRQIGINVLLNTDITPAILADLGARGTVLDTIPAIDALTMRVAAGDVAAIAALPYVAAANPDAERTGGPIDPITAEDHAGGVSTWNLDAVNVTAAPGPTRSMDFDGSGVYVAVLDSGLLDSWRQYFPEQRIATEYGRAFSGGGGERGHVSSPTNQWEHDQSSHGTHVTSIVLGYQFGTANVNGVAPRATIIPVKVLGQNGSGWSSMIAAGIVYVTDLARGPLAGSRIVINMSLGGPSLDAVEQAAIDYAIENGVIVVASAGNEGDQGMGYPGAYPPVISVAASGWVREFETAPWWNAIDVAEPTSASDFYITDFSSRQKPGQDLDVAAPGSWVVGPYQIQSGKVDYFFLGGTSQASPHVAGIAALMVQKSATLNQAQVENILETTAIPLPPGCRMGIIDPISGAPADYCWNADASGAGLATADAALAAVPGTSPGHRKTNRKSSR